MYFAEVVVHSFCLLKLYTYLWSIPLCVIPQCWLLVQILQKLLRNKSSNCFFFLITKSIDDDTLLHNKYLGSLWYTDFLCNKPMQIPITHVCFHTYHITSPGWSVFQTNFKHSDHCLYLQVIKLLVISWLLTLIVNILP